MEVLDKMRRLDPEARIVIATADIQSSTRELTRDAGAIGFLNKPFLEVDVLQTIAAAMKK